MQLNLRPLYKVRRGSWRGMEIAVKTLTPSSNALDGTHAAAAAADLRHEAAILARVSARARRDGKKRWKKNEKNLSPTHPRVFYLLLDCFFLDSLFFFVFLNLWRLVR